MSTFTLRLTEAERMTIYKCLRLMKEAFEVAGEFNPNASEAWHVEYQGVCATYHKIKDSMFWDDRERINH
jgi:hypothetical protein